MYKARFYFEFIPSVKPLGSKAAREPLKLSADECFHQLSALYKLTRHVNIRYRLLDT
jgi:hypothetical protein